MAALGQVMSDVTRDRISVSFARANDTVKMRLAKSSNSVIRSIALFDSTDAAATAAEAASKA
jgi:hypothetical protein